MSSAQIDASFPTTVIGFPEIELFDPRSVMSTYTREPARVISPTRPFAVPAIARANPGVPSGR